MEPRRSSRSDLTFKSAFKGVLVALIVMSCVVNILSLTGSFYMLQVYDRVLTSHNLNTLVALSILAFVLFAFQAILEVIRAQVMRRVSDRIDRKLMPDAHDAALKLPLRGTSRSEAMQPLRDVESVRSFLAGQGPIAIFDLPWIPVYLLFVLLLHPVFALVTVVGLIVLVILTWSTETVTRELNQKVVASTIRRQGIADENSRNAEVLESMGFADRARARLLAASEELLRISAKANDVGSSMASLSRVFRMVLQSAMLGIGAYLTIKGQVTGGAMIAASIASSRALAPIELAIANWRGLSQARQARDRLARLPAMLGESAERLTLPPPKSILRLDNVSVVAPGTQRVLIEGITFEIKAGECLGIIGSSAAGKSTLVRAIAGIWGLRSGSVRIDGATIEQWGSSNLGRHVGYVPQDIQLFDGSITENIARFEENPDSEAVIRAAKAAEIHDMILKIPRGYEARLGSDGAHLSAGQRQRLALARALYRDPFLIILDEPNSNLDTDGEAALIKAVHAVRDRGGIVVMVAHRSNALAAVDQVAVMAHGKIAAFGPRNEILRRFMRGTPGGAGPAPAGGATGAGSAGNGSGGSSPMGTGTGMGMSTGFNLGALPGSGPAFTPAATNGTGVRVDFSPSVQAPPSATKPGAGIDGTAT
ncbi:MAG: type I secretion system permease/ATPase [Hyphomicrobiaceae bacterium]